MGPGYAVEKQEIRVHFEPSPAPRIRVEADYLLKNTGSRALRALELRLPGNRSFPVAALRASWDRAGVALGESRDDPRNSVLSLPESWPVAARRSLHLEFEIPPAGAGPSGFHCAPDAFVLPAGWSPEFRPEPGLFGFGGAPPAEWDLVVDVPGDFAVHTSGTAKSTDKSGRRVLRALERAADRYPFVVAGRYASATLPTPREQVYLWTRAPAGEARVREATASLVQALRAYDSVFGPRRKTVEPLWIVECPVAGECSPGARGPASPLEDSAPGAQMVSLDTVVVDFSGTASPVAAAAPALAASWLGYGQNPGFSEEPPPLAQLPAYGAALGRAAIEGPAHRRETIRRALLAVPVQAPGPRVPEDAAVLRAKGLLFFYGLEDRYGEAVFGRAMAHMLSARRGRGVNLNDLIAAFEAETQQNVAEFVRLWMKRPGVPAEFRARYENASAQRFDFLQEKTP